MALHNLRREVPEAERGRQRAADAVEVRAQGVGLRREDVMRGDVDEDVGVAEGPRLALRRLGGVRENTTNHGVGPRDNPIAPCSRD